MTDLKVIKVTINKAVDKNRAITPVNPVELLIPIENIAALEPVGGDNYSVMLKQDCLIKLDFEIGIISTIIRARDIEII